MRIAVVRPQVPFARGGAEIFSDALVEQLQRRGHEADSVTVPFKWYPGARVLTQAFLWRLLDLTDGGDPARVAARCRCGPADCAHEHARPARFRPRS